MAKNFRELRNKMSPKARDASAREHARLVREMPLGKVRAARDLTQENLAKILHVNQREISKIERRPAMYVSTLATYIGAMGGTLEIRATFPDGRAGKADPLQERRSAA